ncbi:MAG TPA: cobalt-precorrin-6A reductase [Geminicoccaceae bacterium]|nr:cobalt-precorrin-6A reductase [Geminicoccaceae bacterium]
MAGDGSGRRAKLLILGGTAEAVALAGACASRPGLAVISSLAGRTQHPNLPPGDVRIGGFGGAAGLARFLLERGIDRVLDATHPFAAQISAHAEHACREAGVPRVRLLRPPWVSVAGDRWTEVASIAEAAQRLPELGRRVFLTLGNRELDAFAQLDIWFLVRTIETAGVLPLPQGQWLTGRGPFAVEDELSLLRTHAIDVLVTKASGGGATYAKLVAARRAGLPVLMVRRPPPPPGPVVGSVAAALAWLDGSI